MTSAIKERHTAGAVITPDTLFWSDLGDNRIGPILRELTEALADSDPAFVRRVAARMRLMASSLECMSRRMDARATGAAK